MRWKQALVAAAVLGALTSNPLAAQKEAAFTVVITTEASDTSWQPSTWAAERAAMMRTAEHDLHTLQFDEARPRRLVHLSTIDPAGFVLQLFPSQAVVVTVEQRKPHNCPTAARQS